MRAAAGGAAAGVALMKVGKYVSASTESSAQVRLLRRRLMVRLEREEAEKHRDAG